MGNGHQFNMPVRHFHGYPVLYSKRNYWGSWGTKNGRDYFPLYFSNGHFHRFKHFQLHLRVDLGQSRASHHRWIHHHHNRYHHHARHHHLGWAHKHHQRQHGWGLGWAHKHHHNHHNWGHPYHHRWSHNHHNWAHHRWN